MKKKIAFLFFGILCAVAMAGQALAEGSVDDFLHTRTYFGLLGTSVVINGGGEFSGVLYSRMDTPTYEINLLPAISRNFGFGVFAGHREDAYAVELSFWQSNHTTSFGPVSVVTATGSSNFASTAQDSAVYNSINVDFKRYFFTDLEVQPFVNLGVSFPWVVVSNSAADGFGNIGSTTISGLGVNVGVGAEWYLDNNFSVMGSIIQRWASFDQFKGSFDSQFQPFPSDTGPSSHDGSGLEFVVGTTVGFY